MGPPAEKAADDCSDEPETAMKKQRAVLHGFESHPPLSFLISCKTILNKAKLKVKMRTFTAIIQKEEELYLAICPEIGTVSQGRTIEEAIANLKEATELYVEEFPLKEKISPLLTTFEVECLAA